jgi:hypothetical protein
MATEVPLWASVEPLWASVEPLWASVMAPAWLLPGSCLAPAWLRLSIQCPKKIETDPALNS